MPYQGTDGIFFNPTFPGYIPPGSNNLSANAFDTFQYLFQKETGLAGVINWVSSLQDAGIEVGYTLDEEHVRLQCKYNSNEPVIDWEYLTKYY